MVNTYSLITDTMYDKLTRMAAKTLDYPVVILSFLDAGCVSLKSIYGIDAADIHYTQENYPESLFFKNFDVKFYAAAPLVSKDGVLMGNFCLLDNQQGFLSSEKEELLNDFAAMAMAYRETSLAAEQAVAYQKQLLQIAAHDLKNPLTTIPVRADLIKLKKHDPDAVDRMCDQIKQAGLIMTRTIDELLSAASFDAGKLSLYTFKLDFAAIVSQTVEANEALATNKGQRIDLYIESRPAVIADEQRLIEVVDNLINNAVKYSPKGEVITVTVTEKDNKAVMHVQDNGPGLTAEDKSRMFLPYSKLSAHPTGNEKSTGLGLSIVKQLVEAHHGKVWAESDGIGKGSSFFVEIPSFIS
ncbi:GAF domain-containing sensor histidine kinase [Pedobacter immunditicola]|uniref:GAF domain-containing sensor histidine kinase n=1 Tax=Pedobacter immunditicola TaxID=3133440 RepID=UPI0030B1C3F8